MQAFHNDPAIKAFYLARVAAHRDADEIRHGYYWEGGKGCAVGCTLHSSDHAAYELELGIPRILARLEDGIFESLASPEDQVWPHAFLEAIPVGADLHIIWPRFFLRIATDTQYGLLQYVEAPRFAKQKASIQKVIEYYAQWVSEGEKPAAYAAAAVAAADAYTAAADAYTAAAYAAAAAVAADAYTAAAYAAAAAVAAADTDAASDAFNQKKRSVRLWQGEILLALLREAPGCLISAAAQEVPA